MKKPAKNAAKKAVKPVLAWAALRNGAITHVFAPGGLRSSAATYISCTNYFDEYRTDYLTGPIRVGIRPVKT